MDGGGRQEGRRDEKEEAEWLGSKWSAAVF
jgi:hypothetical protein